MRRTFLSALRHCTGAIHRARVSPLHPQMGSRVPATPREGRGWGYSRRSVAPARLGAGPGAMNSVRAMGSLPRPSAKTRDCAGGAKICRHKKSPLVMRGPGTGERTRTLNRPVWSRVLCQLSYSRTRSRAFSGYHSARRKSRAVLSERRVILMPRRQEDTSAVAGRDPVPCPYSSCILTESP
jgi:hypothetical protein